MNINFFGGESCLGKRRNLFSGWQYIWWPNVCKCWIRSSPIEFTYSYKNWKSHSSVYLDSPCENVGPETHSLAWKSGKSGWCSFKREDCDTKRCQNLMTLIPFPRKFWCDTAWHLLQSTEILDLSALQTLWRSAAAHCSKVAVKPFWVELWHASQWSQCTVKHCERSTPLAYKPF
jgi:hypothetical protein